MQPKKPLETEAQKQSRIRAEKGSVRSLQSNVQQRTNMFRRLKSPRISIATGRSSAAIPLR